jgi:hypothetical protein
MNGKARLLALLSLQGRLPFRSGGASLATPGKGPARAKELSPRVLAVTRSSTVPGRREQHPSVTWTEDAVHLLVGLERFTRSLALPTALLFMTTTLNADDAIPTGFKADRYRGLWEHNPFTLVTPAAQAQPETFSRYSVVSWLNEGGKNSLFVQDGDTNDIEKVSEVANEKGLRLIEVHSKGGKDFQMIRDFEAVISNGSEQGTIKFKPQTTAPTIAGNPMNPVQMPMQMEGGQNVPGQLQLPRQLNMPVQNPNVQPSVPYTNQNGNVPPQAQQVRRRRVLPSPAVNITPGVPQPPNGINRGQ